MRGGTAVCSATYAFNGICTIEALFLKPQYRAPVFIRRRLLNTFDLSARDASAGHFIMAMPHGARPSVRRRCGGGWVCLPGIIPAVDVVQPDCTASNAKGRAKIFPSLLFAVSHFIRKFAVSSGFFMLPYGMKRKNLGFSGTKTEHKNKRCTENQSVTPLYCRDEAIFRG